MAMRSWAVVGLAGLAAGVGAGAGGAQPDGRGTERGVHIEIDPLDADRDFARRLSSAFASAALSVEASVVHITSVERMRRYGRDAFGRRFLTGEEYDQPAGLGSGVVIDTRGHVVTNAHVITVDPRTRDYADRLVVRLSDGREFDATVVGVDDGSDLAVLRIDAEGLKPALWGDAEAASIGQWVLAIGSPFGFDQTVTAGIISSKGRPPLGSQRSGLDLSHYQEFIQTDAAINPGNSGGPLVDLDGKIIGINTAIASRGGGNSGLGFAIPADLARSVTEQIIASGRVDRGYIGIGWDPAAMSIEPELARRLGVPGGVRVSTVGEGSPAHEAGLEPGDIIVAFAGRATENVNRLRNAIAITRPGAEVPVEFFRDGRRRTERVTVIDRLSGIASSPDTGLVRPLGLVAANTTLTLTRRGREAGTRRGVVVLDLQTGGPADRAGLQPNDVILEVDGREIEDVNDLLDRTRPDDLAEGVTLTLFRQTTNGAGMTGTVEIHTGE